jgi:hypothetical protein
MSSFGQMIGANDNAVSWGNVTTVLQSMTAYFFSILKDHILVFTKSSHFAGRYSSAML